MKRSSALVLVSQSDAVMVKENKKNFSHCAAFRLTKNMINSFDYPAVPLYSGRDAAEVHFSMDKSAWRPRMVIYGALQPRRLHWR